jgi:hypothetical protein
MERVSYDRPIPWTRQPFPVAVGRSMGAILACVWIAGCAPSGDPGSRRHGVRAEFLPGGVLLSASDIAGGGRAGLESTSGELLALQECPRGGGRSLYIPFAWRPGTEYRLFVRTARGSVRSSMVRAPSPAEKPPVSMELPARSPVSGHRRLAVPAGSRIDGRIRLSLCGSEPAAVTLRLERSTDMGWEVGSDDTESVAKADAFRWIVTLTPADPVRVIPIAAVLPDEVRSDQEHGLELSYRYSTASGLLYEGSSHVVLVAGDPETWKNAIAIQSGFPCDPQGQLEVRRARDTIGITPGWLSWIADRLRLRVPTASYWDPVGFQNVTVSSKADVHLPVVVHATVLTADGSVAAPGFRQLGTGSSFLKAVDRILLEIPPGGQASGVLPLFATPEVAPGNYLREIRVTSAGTDVELARTSFPLSVSRSRSWEQAGTIGTLLLAFGFLASAPWTARAVFRRLGTRDLVTIALFAGLTVAVVHLPLLVGGAVFVGLLGPFSFLVNNLLGQGLASTLLTALLCIVPEKGALALAIIVRYGLGAVLFGAVSPLDVLFAASSIPLIEGAVQLAGIGRRQNKPVLPNTWFGVWLALAAGLTGGLHLLVSASVFRLFYAPWYYVLYAAVCALYSLLGAWLGLALGKGLRRVRE